MAHSHIAHTIHNHNTIFVTTGVFPCGVIRKATYINRKEPHTWKKCVTNTNAHTDRLAARQRFRRPGAHHLASLHSLRVDCLASCARGHEFHIKCPDDLRPRPSCSQSHQSAPQPRLPPPGSKSSTWSNCVGATRNCRPVSLTNRQRPTGSKRQRNEAIHCAARPRPDPGRRLQGPERVP